MATADIIREAALYLEYFLKGLSECNVIGSYAVQFLELRGFSIRLEASLASHLIRLLTNMKGLLLKLDTSLIPFCHVEVQTEETVLCSLCNSQSSLGTTIFKTNSLQDTKPAFEETSINKTYESPEITQLFNTAPLIELKQEMPCMDHTATSRIEQCNRKDLDTNIIHIESLDSKESLKLREHTLSSDTKNEKCNDSLSFQNALDGNINLEYASTSQLEEGQGEILLDHMEGSDTAASEGLMYSVYTMGSCGSLQLVSRVLSKSNMVKDSFNEPVEKAMIEINNMKEELVSQDPIDTPHLQRGSVQNQESVVNQEEMRIAPPSPDYEDKSYPKILSKNFKPSKSPPSKIAEVTACGSILTDIVKLGPEDLDSATWCRICEKEFPSIGSLKVHVSRIHNQVKWCNTCNKIINSEDMCNHVRECHSDLPYVCNVCGQSLRNNGAYQRHMDIHKGLRGSACEICGQTFSRTEYYREHKRIHTGEKPFKCETCKKTFSRSSNLYTHMRIHNTEEQRHMCNICLKSFARADKLKDHMIRHLQIKRYACRMCSKSYNERRDLVKHLDKIHSNDDNCGTD